MVKLTFTKALQSEINQIAQSAPIHKIIQGKTYLYFSLQPTQEEIQFKEICRSDSIKCFEIRNFKNTMIGYLVLLGKPPEFMNLHEYGAAIYYTKVLGKVQDLKKAGLKYSKIKVCFSDAKFRVMAFNSKDFFVSVKWKSNNPLE
jgi:hypothetical protein